MQGDTGLTHTGRWMGLIICCLCCIACGSVFTPEMRSQIDPNLSYAALLANPASHIGRHILLAGTIVEATNLQDHTRLVMLQYPTGRRDDPKTRQPSGGRFLIVVPGYLETEIYRTGRALSVIGEVKGQETLPLDDTTYTYPVITSRDFYLWPKGSDDPRFYFSFGAGFSKGF